MARSICFYTDSRQLGGAELALLMLLEGLDAEAWEPTLLLDEGAGAEALAERAAALGVEVRRVAPMPLGLAGARRAAGLARRLRKERPAVFHAHLSWPLAAKWALAAAVAARVPTVATVQLIPEFRLGRSSYWQLRTLARRVDRYVAVSHDMATELSERFRWPAAKIEVVHNAVRPERFRTPAPPGLREEIGGGPDRPLVLTCARLDEQKGHRVLLRAAAQLPGVAFALAGEGPERGALEALAAQLGVADRVAFLGQRTDIAELLAACDAFALPSLYEGSSLALLEAMAARRAVVTSAIGGSDELIADGESGLLVPPGDAAALSAALRALLDDAGLRARLAERARERVERDFTPATTIGAVERVYRELTGAGTRATDAIPEARLNRLLRSVDWRFLLRTPEAPRIADLRRGRTSPALETIAAERAPAPGGADVAVIGFPTRRSLRAARAALRPGGEVVCLWRLPHPDGVRRAAARLRGAGFAGARVLWPGPIPFRTPQFWLPLGSPQALAHLLAGRPPRSLRQAAPRPLWRLAARAGMLAPLCAIGGPRDEGEPPANGIEAALPGSAAVLLLTGGERSINKVAGLPFGGAGDPDLVVKFARVPAADAALDREAEALRAIERAHPGVAGVPRLLARERRAGRTALAESAIHGAPLISKLTPESFGELAELVTGWLVELAAGSEPRPAAEWWERLVGEPLAAFARELGDAVGDATVARVRERLAGLGELPVVPEHRDCSPWNVILTASGAPALLDWESAEPRGLPGLDLAFFLANAAFVLDGALESGHQRESYVRLLDPAGANGRVAARCAAEYRRRLGLSEDAYSRLRLLAWVVHSRSDYRHLEMAGAAAPSPEALRAATYPGLVEAELSLAERR